MDGTTFLQYAGEHYKELKNKWTTRLKKHNFKFSDDIYNTTIIKVYDHIQKEGYHGDIEPYFYKSFLQNTKREIEYSYNKKDDSIDVLKYLDEFPTDDKPILLEDIKEKLQKLTDIEFHIFLIYYLTDFTYSEIEQLTDIKDIRYKIKTIFNKIKKGSPLS